MALPTFVRKHSLIAVTAALFGLAIWRLWWQPELPAVLAFIFGGVVLGVIDWRYHRLPTKLVYYTLAGVATGLVFGALVSWDWWPLLMATAGAVILANAFYAVHILGTKFLGMRIIGFGDVRLAFILGALLGWAGLSYLFTGMVVAMLVALPVALWTLWRERKFTVNIAFGTPLMIGTLAVVLLHA